jgi:predicted nucleotidyltransferase
MGRPGRLEARDVHWGVDIKIISNGEISNETIAEALHGSRLKQQARVRRTTGHPRNPGGDYLDGLFGGVSV